MVHRVLRWMELKGFKDLYLESGHQRVGVRFARMANLLV